MMLSPNATSRPIGIEDSSGAPVCGSVAGNTTRRRVGVGTSAAGAADGGTAVTFIGSFTGVAVIVGTVFDGSLRTMNVTVLVLLSVLSPPLVVVSEAVLLPVAGALSLIYARMRMR